MAPVRLLREVQGVLVQDAGPIPRKRATCMSDMTKTRPKPTICYCILVEPGHCHVTACFAGKDFNSKAHGWDGSIVSPSTLCHYNCTLMMPFSSNQALNFEKVLTSPSVLYSPQARRSGSSWPRVKDSLAKTYTCLSAAMMSTYFALFVSSTRGLSRSSFFLSSGARDNRLGPKAVFALRLVPCCRLSIGMSCVKGTPDGLNCLSWSAVSFWKASANLVKDSSCNTVDRSASDWLLVMGIVSTKFWRSNCGECKVSWKVLRLNSTIRFSILWKEFCRQMAVFLRWS